MSETARIQRLARIWSAHLYYALEGLLAVYPDIPKRSLHPYTPIAPSAN